MAIKDSKKLFDAIIIGGGPAGMMTSIIASRRGKIILLLEKNNSLGKKLLISGKSRCNLTNAVDDIEEFITHFSLTGRFLRNAFNKFFNHDLIKFFETKGLALKVEQGKRVFPQSNKSEEVLKVLIRTLKGSGVKILLSTNVIDVKRENSFLKVITEDKKQYLTSKVVLATGGMSYPQTGSDGYGLKIARNLGHSIIQPRPGLVAVNLEGKLHKCWQGVALKNVECQVKSEGKVIDKRFGEMLFTHFGASGPIILDLSSKIYDTIKQNQPACIVIDFKPALSEKQLDMRLMREFRKYSNKHISNVMKELIPRRLIGGFLESISIDEDKKANQVSKDERLRLVKQFKSFTFKIRSVRSIKEAIITRGGVSTLEINPQSMESKLINGLYFVGEMVDVDAATGGYNMQAAFSTGYICGENI